MGTRTVGPESDALVAAIDDLRAHPERRRDEVVLEFSPQRLREAEVDPVSVLDRFRSVGLRPEGVGLPADPGELVLEVDASGGSATLRLVPVAAPPGAGERLLPARRRLGRRTASDFPPVPPGTLGYDAAKRALVCLLLEDVEWQAVFAAADPLPAGLGAGYDERVVEYPWLFSQRPRGRVLDAGSVMNHRNVLERALTEIAELTIVTLAPEPHAFTSLGVSYLYADLREMPLRDDWFDEVVCLSTIEHVGMDNATYGASAERAEDPGEEAARALRELLRVVKPGGRIHLSFPFGRREDHGWLRQFDRAEADALFERAGVGRREEAFFAHSPAGWQRVSAADASDVAYNAEPVVGDDLAVAARAVLCATVYA
jgi:SAM-dependent methyltransferase